MAGWLEGAGCQLRQSPESEASRRGRGADPGPSPPVQGSQAARCHWLLAAVRLLLQTGWPRIRAPLVGPSPAAGAGLPWSTAAAAMGARAAGTAGAAPTGAAKAAAAASVQRQNMWLSAMARLLRHKHEVQHALRRCKCSSAELAVSTRRWRQATHPRALRRQRRHGPTRWVLGIEAGARRRPLRAVRTQGETSRLQSCSLVRTFLPGWRQLFSSAFPARWGSASSSLGRQGRTCTRIVHGNAQSALNLHGLTAQARHSVNSSGGGIDERRLGPTAQARRR